MISSNQCFLGAFILRWYRCETSILDLGDCQRQAPMALVAPHTFQQGKNTIAVTMSMMPVAQLTGPNPLSAASPPTHTSVRRGDGTCQMLVLPCPRKDGSVYSHFIRFGRSCFLLGIVLLLSGTLSVSQVEIGRRKLLEEIQ